MEIKITNVDHIYMPKTPFEHHAIKNINVHIKSGQFVAIIGHTGSGKSTIVQLLNGLIKPTSGKVQVGQYIIEANKKAQDLQDLRKKVGFVFQYPEHQLFDETVEKDIAFGPMNFGLSKEEAYSRVEEVLPLVKLDRSILQKSPFDLSGGQKRRVAIAGVLASKPRVLVLDEPTAGLDPVGRNQMMQMFVDLHMKEKLTTVFVTHNMDFAALYADHIIVMDKGKVLLQGNPEQVFQSTTLLNKIGLDVPQTVQFTALLEKRFDVKLPTNLFTNEQVVSVVTKLMNGEV